jgi:hypothetical protein
VAGPRGPSLPKVPFDAFALRSVLAHFEGRLSVDSNSGTLVHRSEVATWITNIGALKNENHRLVGFVCAVWNMCAFGHN